MKKMLLFTILGLLLATPAFAGPDINSLTRRVVSSSGFDPFVTDTTISQNVGKVIKSALSLVGTVFLILTVYAGFLWMTASGDDAQVEKAMNIVKRSAIGFIIVVAAYSLTAFVIGNVLKASNTGSTVGGSSKSSNNSGSWWTDFWSGVGKGVGDTHKKLKGG